ncbi:hypothetical protein OX284_004770 [Flavobacterium sp. SUN046]|uniref:tetratricopeptide repeat protein n=1 Tax=Flavobacterium sp. SUN046 TaxID=3002440 RepID=UPI002DB893B1|nr:hypothetical protein [Flavobacterium sp. SUN046]MEC4048734.1 hypothetical protein [Flavobacterium sp. SUN046]
MKIKQIIVAGTLLVSVASFAQKDELKALKKIYDRDTPSAEDVIAYKANLNKLETLATQEGDKVYLNYYKAVLPQIEIASLGTNTPPKPEQLAKLFTPKAISDIATAYSTTLEFEKTSGKKIFTDDINEDLSVLKPMLFQVVVSLDGQKKYKEASQVFYALYQLDKKDVENLYYAASYATNGQDYDKALGYYTELKNINYTGEGISYLAKNKATGNEETYKTKLERDQYVLLGTHTAPREEKIPSKKGEIYKNIALILVDKGRTDEAKTAISDARKANPDDTSLMLTEANLYLRLNDKVTYSKIVSEVLQKDPNNPELLFNLAVLSSDTDSAQAEKYYKKAIEIKPDYFDAYLNLSELLLRSDEKFVKEMNSLGTSEKDNKRYEALKLERNNSFKKIMPYLEKAVELKPDNQDAKTTLIGVYSALEMTDKAKALKDKK